MMPTYRATYDGVQWCLTRTAESTSRSTGEATLVERIVGYYPRFDQVVARMYECAVGDGIDEITMATLEDAVKQAKVIRDELEQIPNCKDCIMR